MASTSEQRRAEWASTPRVELMPEHTRNCRVLPNRLCLLEALPKQAIGAEVGVAYGDFTAEILRRAEPACLHLVDVWSGERYASGLDKVMSLCQQQLETGSVRIHRGLSVEILPSFEDAYFDWIYIDTDHSYDTTLRELQLAAPKTKFDGRLMGHDFCVGNIITPWLYGVIQACNKFCLDQHWQYEYITLESHGHFSFSLTKL